MFVFLCTLLLCDNCPLSCCLFLYTLLLYDNCPLSCFVRIHATSLLSSSRCHVVTSTLTTLYDHCPLWCCCSYTYYPLRSLSHYRVAVPTHTALYDHCTLSCCCSYTHYPLRSLSTIVLLFLHTLTSTIIEHLSCCCSYTHYPLRSLSAIMLLFLHILPSTIIVHCRVAVPTHTALYDHCTLSCCSYTHYPLRSLSPYPIVIPTLTTLYDHCPTVVLLFLHTLPSTITVQGGALERAQSGSMPDLVMQGGPPTAAHNQHAMKRSDSSDWTAVSVATASAAAAQSGSVFTEGIVGKTLLKEAETGGGGRGSVVMESKPLLPPPTPKLRSRRGARPSSRRSALGLRDRGPLEPAAPSVTSTSTTSLWRSSSPTRSKPGSSETNSQPTEHALAYSQTLPVLTITGLNRERPPPGTPASNSRAAREMRPTSRAGVANSSLQRFQQLDDQCEKLQRQLNIGLNVSRHAPHWQVSLTGGEMVSVVEFKLLIAWLGVWTGG